MAEGIYISDEVVREISRADEPKRSSSHHKVHSDSLRKRDSLWNASSIPGTKIFSEFYRSNHMWHKQLLVKNCL